MVSILSCWSGAVTLAAGAADCEGSWALRTMSDKNPTTSARINAKMKRFMEGTSRAAECGIGATSILSISVGSQGERGELPIFRQPKRGSGNALAGGQQEDVEKAD